YYYYSTVYVPATTTPIKIGVVIQESGFLALAGVPGLTAIKIWANDTNAAGGLLGHKIQIIAYDDASDTSKVPALIQKLISVDNETYPTTQTDFSSLMTKVKSTNPDIAFVCSYPPDSVGIVQAAKEVNFVPKLMGGGMIGPQFTALEAALGKTLQGVVTFAYWVPEPTINFPGVNTLIQKYEAVANASGAAAFDPLGYLYPPYSYAALQMLGQAVTACNCLGNNAQRATYIHGHTFSTVGGDMNFTSFGEWTYSRVLWIQYQNIAGASVNAFAGPGHQVIVWPATYKSGNLAYPFPGWQG